MFAEKVTVTSQYPSPLGVYKNLRVTENSYLAINSGSGVGIGTTAITYGKLDLIAADDYGVYVSLDGTGGASAYGIYANVSGATSKNWALYAAAGNLYVADQVGIGTVSMTNMKLKLYYSGSGASDAYGIYSNVSGSSSKNWSFFAANGDAYFADKVAVGTQSPGHTMHVVDNYASTLHDYNVFQAESSGSGRTAIYGKVTGVNSTAGSFYGYVSGLGAGTLRGVYSVVNAGSDGTAYAYGGEFRGIGGGEAFGGYFSANAATTNKALYAYISDADATTNYGLDAYVRSAVNNYALRASASGGSGVNYALYVSAGDTYVSCDALNGVWETNTAYARCRDLAEVFVGGEKMEAGDIVVLRNAASNAMFKSSKPYEDGLAGVYSTAPGLVLGSRGVEEGTIGLAFGGHPKMKEGEFPLALVGRVPVKATDEGGKIEAGDRVTSSSKPGFAMKAAKAGRVLGVALESFEGKEGKVFIMVNPQWWDGGEVAQLREENEAMKLRLDKLEKKLAER
ncbi:MAG: hypothetical protein HY547_10395 [Elusimicrobia bacterium]|nr:hypothetical protein [Elusimicrobiota bacterium]